ncbi:MAG: hypothetical protein WCW25_05225 [Patescibacteria group bacterium]
MQHIPGLSASGGVAYSSVGEAVGQDEVKLYIPGPKGEPLAVA